MERVLDFVEDMLWDAAEVIVPKTTAGAKKARGKGMRVPFGGERETRGEA